MLVKSDQSVTGLVTNDRARHSPTPARPSDGRLLSTVSRRKVAQIAPSLVAPAFQFAHRYCIEQQDVDSSATSRLVEPRTQVV